MTPYSIRTTVNPLVFKKYWLIKYFIKPLTFVFYGAILAVVTMGVIGVLPPFFWWLAVAFGLFLPLSVYVKAHKTYHSNPILRREVTFHFNSDDLNIQHGDVNKTYPYTELYQISVDSSFLLVFLNSSVAFFIGMDQLTDSGGRQLIQELKTKDSLAFIDKR